MPTEILLRFYSHLDSIDNMRNLVNTSRRLNFSLDNELYKESGRRINWLPLFIGAQKGDIKLLERCERAGAPLDTTWQLTHTYPDVNFSKFCRPIHLAVEYRKPVVVKWLLEQDTGANGSDYITECGHFKSLLELAMRTSPVDAGVEQWSLARRQKAGLDNKRIFEALLEKGADPKGKIAEYGHLLRLAFSHDNGIRHGIPFLTLLVQKGVNLNVLCQCKDHCTLNPLPGPKARLRDMHFKRTFRPVTALDIRRLIWDNKLCPTTLSYMEKMFDFVVYWSLDATEDTQYRRQRGRRVVI